MLILKSKKGDFGVTILIAVIAVAMVFGGVLYFFYVFKAHATLEVREEYIWNKVQEAPLNLLSMDIENELFVSKLNKVYYNFEDESQLTNKTDEILTKQIFYFLEEAPLNQKISIKFAQISISKYLAGCKIVARGVCTMGICNYYCNDKCGVNADKYLGSFTLFQARRLKLSDCTYQAGITIKFSEKYPFPLTFNGTNELIGNIEYDFIQEGG